MKRTRSRSTGESRSAFARWGWGRPQLPWAVVCVGACFLVACSGGDGGSTEPASQPPLDAELVALAKSQLGLTGDPASPRNAVQIAPDDDPLVKLGQLLFFSQTLAAGYDVSCGTCHHPAFGGSDALSIPVGVAPKDAAAVGPFREVDPLRDLDPSADGGPNMHRNSLTTFNAGLFDRGLMYDARVFVLDEATRPGGHGQSIRTPESGLRVDGEASSGLLEFAVKGPIVNDNEMRGFAYTEYPTSAEYREHLVRRLRGNVDTELNRDPNGPAHWLALFRAAFGDPEAAPAELITMLNVQRALAAYIRSQTFVDTPWRRYLDGDLASLSERSKRGALLFLRSKDEGGLGCAACHSGDRFTDERFHNVGFPQLGRGFLRTDKNDFGRWTSTRAAEDLQAFRTPSLLNVAVTAPYGHAGSFDTLEDAIRYHANPRAAVDDYDFSLVHLAQFRWLGISYEHAEPHTRLAVERSNFATAEALLTQRTPAAGEVADLVAFLGTLTDVCVDDFSCISRWTPRPDEDPDGHMLVRNVSTRRPLNPGASEPADYPERVTMAFPAVPARTTFADVEACTDGLAAHDNTGDARFLRTEASLGLDDAHGFSAKTWFDHPSLVEVAMIAGGVSAAYLTDDCWPDLIFAGGDASGMVLYENRAGVLFEPADLLAEAPEREFSGAAIADLNGDYRREVLLGNVRPATEIPVYAQNGAGRYERIAALPMSRPTFGISFAPLDGTGYPYFFLAHWAEGSGTDGTAPALWKNDGVALTPWDTQAGTSPAEVDQRFNFTPKFADFTGDGTLDLVIASDFLTSATLRNVSDGLTGPVFENETARLTISDENGMGSALLDIDNDGVLEWFVTSVYDDSGVVLEGSNWGRSGNRLYRSASTLDGLAFEDITLAAGVENGYWGWGACAADVDNDGFVDLFHVNGFGHIPDGVVSEATRRHYDGLTSHFQDRPARLFVNGRDGAFVESANAWGIDAPSEGRGVVCFDYDRDGDVDIVVFDHSAGLQLYENMSGSGEGRRFLNVRLVGEPPNTEAIGARVYVTADVGHGAGNQTQLRLSEANSNFNSQNTPDLHFGLGQASVIDELRVVWPGSTELVCDEVPVNRFLVLDERDGSAACP